MGAGKGSTNGCLEETVGDGDGDGDQNAGARPRSYIANGLLLEILSLWKELGV